LTIKQLKGWCKNKIIYIYIYIYTLNERERERNVYKYLLLSTTIYSKFKVIFNMFIDIKSNFKNQ